MGLTFKLGFCDSKLAMALSELFALALALLYILPAATGQGNGKYFQLVLQLLKKSFVGHVDLHVRTCSFCFQILCVTTALNAVMRTRRQVLFWTWALRTKTAVGNPT